MMKLKPQEEITMKKFYYCPHCGRFKRRFQVKTDGYEYVTCVYLPEYVCRHCGTEIDVYTKRELEEELKEWNEA
jgi:transposase-like protein